MYPTRMLAAVAIAVASAVVGSAPALATVAAPTLSVLLRDRTVATPGPGVVDGAIVIASEPVTLNDVVITYDFGDVAGFVTVTENNPIISRCTASGPTTLRCPQPFAVHADDGGVGLIGDILIAPTSSAAEGDEGTLRVTLEATGYAPVSSDARIRIGEGVDLAAGAEEQREAAPGQPFTEPLRVTNIGDTAVTGAGVLFFTDFAFRAGSKFSNCTYVGDRPRTCRFDTVLNPRTGYRTDFPFLLGPDTYAPSHAAAEFLWLPSAEFEDFVGNINRLGFDTGTPGGGGVLALQTESALQAQAIQADTDPRDNFAHLTVEVTGTNGTDLAAVGATLTGRVGDVVTTVVGLHNNGPATLSAERSGGALTVIHVTVPPGTTAVGVPSDCFPETSAGMDGAHPGQPGAAKYACPTGLLLVASEDELVEFQLRIDSVIAGATGTVSILEPCECEGFPPTLDLNNANNRANIVVNPVAGTPPLAATGAKVGAIATVGVVLLVAGMMVVMLTRRRRRAPAG